MNLSESEQLMQGHEAKKIGKCDHCGTPLSPTDIRFCCRGCEFVYSSIHALGLSNFYSLRSSQDVESGEKVQPIKNYAYLNDPEVFKEITETLSSGDTLVRFYLPTIHCAACVWILEKLPSVVDGVVSSRVSFSSGQIEITANLEKIKLDKLAGILHSIGYPPVPATDQRMEAENKREKRSMLMRIGVAAVCAANTMMIADSLFQSFFTGMDKPYLTLFTWVSAVIAFPAVTWAALPFYRSAIGTLITGRVHIDLPISIAIVVSYVSDVVTTVNGSGHVYFDSITSLIFLLLVARYIQRQSLFRSRASTATSWDLFPSIVKVCEGDALVEKSLHDVMPGDILEVQPEERIPSDAKVVSGSSSVDTSFLTGESIPKHVSKGDKVLGGSLNIDGVIRILVEEIGEKTRLGRILNVLKRNQGKTTLVEEEANKFSSYFVVTVLFLSALTFIYWQYADPLRALPITVSLLVITCPCALGLAVPVTVAVALSQARKNKFFIQNTQSIHTLSKAQNFYFDKTGTLTSGKLEVVGCEATDEILSIVKSLTNASSMHPVSKALKDHTINASFQNLRECKHIPGKGVSGVLNDGKSVSLGSYRWFIERETKFDNSIKDKINGWISDGITVSLFEREGECIGVFGLFDEVKEESLNLVRELQNKGKNVFILSGDIQSIVNRISDKLNIPRENALGELYPEQKAEIISNDSKVKVFIGDGLNDAQAMQVADVGIGLHGGIESTLEATDIFISGEDLEGFSRLLKGSFKIKSVIRSNLIFSILYNVMGAGMAVTGNVTPLVAAILMPISSFTVILNSSMKNYFKNSDG